MPNQTHPDWWALGFTAAAGLLGAGAYHFFDRYTHLRQAHDDLINQNLECPNSVTQAIKTSKDSRITRYQLVSGVVMKHDPANSDKSQLLKAIQNIKLKETLAKVTEDHEFSRSWFESSHSLSAR